MYWKSSCGAAGEDDCGWWYLDNETNDEFWVTCQTFTDWSNNGYGWEEESTPTEPETCDYEWIWEDWTGMYWKSGCGIAGETECGWWYLAPEDDSEFWVTCETFEEW